MYMVLIAGLGLVCTSVVFVCRAAGLSRARSRERVSQLAAYGYGAPAPTEAAAKAKPLSGGLDRIAGLLGGFVSGRLKSLSEAELRRELVSAGMYRTSPVTLAGYRVIGAVTFPVTLLWFSSTTGTQGALVVLCVPLVAAIGWLAPMTVVRRRARERLTRIDDDLPELVDLLVVTVESGLGFAGSLQMAAEPLTGPLGDELRLMLQEQAMGLPAANALDNVLARADTPAMRSFVRSVQQGESLGVSIGQIMRTLALEMRQRRRATAEAKAQRAPIKMLFPLVLLIFPVIFIVLLTPAILSIGAAFGGGS
jgi:tight adherence protein C